MMESNMVTIPCDKLKEMQSAIATLTAKLAESEKQLAEAMKDAEIGKAMNRACLELPEGIDLEIALERNAGTIRLFHPESDCYEHEFEGDTFGAQINSAIDEAIRAMKEE